MRGTAHGVLCALVAWTVAGAHAQMPTFRSDVRVITVNAAIELGRRPLLGLSADDFVLLDNSVRQTVTQVAYETVPVDVTVIVDVSASTVAALKTLERDAQRIMSLLRPTERLRMLAIDTYVQEVFALGAAPTLPPSMVATVGGWSAVQDAMAAALLLTPDPDRRRLVVALTDGDDTASVTSRAQLVRVARASDAVLIVVLVPPDARGVGRIRAGDRLLADVVFPIDYTGMPDSGSIAEATRVTGGELLRQSAFGNRRVDAIQRIIQTFRQSYVLRYVPTDVEPGGWHDIELRINGQPNAAIRARRGYFGG